MPWHDNTVIELFHKPSSSHCAFGMVLQPKIYKCVRKKFVTLKSKYFEKEKMYCPVHDILPMYSKFWLRIRIRNRRTAYLEILLYVNENPSSQCARFLTLKINVGRIGPWRWMDGNTLNTSQGSRCHSSYLYLGRFVLRVFM